LGEGTDVRCSLGPESLIADVDVERLNLSGITAKALVKIFQKCLDPHP
jgi:hypothetical protein